MSHANAQPTPAGRLRLSQLIMDEGCSHSVGTTGPPRQSDRRAATIRLESLADDSV